MSSRKPFGASDLEELDACLFSRAARVVPMRDVFKGDRASDVIALRHDVDDNPGSLDTALRMAEWEFDHGYSSTYYLLHGSHYWGEECFVAAERLVELGHEVGLHNNAIAEAFRQKRDPLTILAEALAELRASVPVYGVVAHGDDLCYIDKVLGTLRFVNDEVFSESPRPNLGAASRIVYRGDVAVVIEPVPRHEFGIEYDAAWLPRDNYLSDSWGLWSQPLEAVAEAFGRGQLHVLQHPDWWSHAFMERLVA